MVLQDGPDLIGVEVKRTDAPRMTPSIRSAIESLGLARVLVAHAGTHRFTLAENVEAIGAAELLTDGLPS